MGTHPIFESDFDCLAEMTKKAVTEWDAEKDVSLFQALRGHKPVGIAKNFHMMCIMEKIRQSLGKPVDSRKIWYQLQELYSLDLLEETEVSPLQEKEKIGFSLEGMRVENRFSPKRKKLEK